MKARRRTPRSDTDPPAAIQESQAEGWEPALTPREVQVLRLVIKCKKSKEIADELGLSERTIEVYRAHLKLKLHTKTAAELKSVAQGMNLGSKDSIGDEQE
jgi:DNA-binding NarL/FixJ family response regulator